MTKLLCTPFCREAWKLHGNVRDGTIFLIEDKPRQNLDKRQREFVYGGYKFEALCMVKPTDGVVSMSQRVNQIVNNYPEYGILFKSTLGKHRLLLGAEVDGLDEDGKRYVELKTCSNPDTPYAIRNFNEHKLVKWWTQSFLAGIPKIIIGYRNRRMWVERIESLQVSDIPKRVRGNVRWDPQVILAFGDLFFTWLGQIILAQANPPSDEITKFTLSYDPKTDDDAIEIEFEGPSFLLNGIF